MGNSNIFKSSNKPRSLSKDLPHLHISSSVKTPSISTFFKNKFRKKSKNVSEHYPEDLVSNNETMIILEGSPSMKKIQQLRSKETSNEQFKIYINPVNNYQMGQLIGYGPHGSVCEALSMNNGEQVAIKKVLCKSDHIDTIKYYLQKKLLDIDHFNLVNYIEVEELENCEINIVSELISGSSLESVLNLFGKLKENVCKLFIEQILRGLDHLHKKGSYHGNLKPRNIFIDKNGKVKLGDFFIISRKMIRFNELKNLKNKPICYLSPEYIKDQSKSSKTDIWALGCILLEMLTKEKPWKHNYCNLTFMKDAILNNKTPEIPKNLSELCKNFIKKMLRIKEEERASIEELLNHPFIRVKEDEGEIKISKELKKTTSTFHQDKSPKKKNFEKSKTNQQMLFVKLKSVMGNNKEKDEEIPDKKFKINFEDGNSKLSNGNVKNSNGNVKNPNKILMRLTTAEIRKKNEEERKKFEEELLKSFNE